MDHTNRSNPAAFTRRSVLASALGVGAAAFLSGCDVAGGATEAASTALEVDFGKTDFFPLLKSKTGVGRALSTTRILDSLPFMDQIRPALYDGELRFPDTDYPSLTPYPFEVAEDGEVTVSRNDFLDDLFSGLRRRNIEIMVQLEGAPKQYWDYDKDDRPHLFPKPDELANAAKAVGKWTKLYSADHPISWCMWNEPSHTLTGSPDTVSVKQMTDIYAAYTNAIAPQGLFGMASFITPSATVRPALGNRTHLQASTDALRERLEAQPGLPFDYLTLNNYGEDLSALFAGARNALGTDFNTVPLIQAQSGVFLPGEWEERAGSTLEAARSMKSLEKALRVADLQTFTFSGWISHLIAYKGGEALQLPLFNALKLFARMPERRGTLQGDLPSGVGAMVSGDEHRSAVLMWNETDQPHTFDVRLTHLRTAGADDAEVRVHHIDSEHGSPLEGSDHTFAPTEVTALDQVSASLTKTVTVAGPGIAYVEVGAKSAHPVLDREGLDAALVRKHTYADRIADQDGKVSVRGNAYGCYDAVRAIAYVGVKGDKGTALVGAEYTGLPDQLKVGISAEGLAAEPLSSESVFGIRVDYLQGDKAVKSVLWHGDTFTGSRTGALPWGRGGATADVLVDTRALDSTRADGSTLTLPLARRAPSGWAAAGRRAIVSFWMDSTGPGSQARFLLG
ncbi:hypothetical protein ACFV6E_23100 [Streptomyces sp. NPDC059785]|uniref:hypothetical protein n=1 Tax=Streptomyces sp. NPDC059785 TaxID=3346945 RepID=UPI00364DE18F